MNVSRLPLSLYLSLSLPFGLMLAGVTVAKAAPGEDPVVMTQKQGVMMLPGGSMPSSTNAVLTDGMPSWLRARVARFESKAMTEPADKSVLTDKDLRTQATGEGMKKTCIQDIGSVASAGSTGFSQYGPKGQDQVVVLRGDVVNVCK